MRSHVLQFFANLPASPEEQFNEAFALFRKSPGKNPSSERFLNTSGYTKINLENLFYDLKTLHSISDADIRGFVVPEEKVIDIVPAPKTILLTEDITITATTPQEVFTQAPSEVKETIKLRDEFPFLNNPDCPEELFILVGKKFAHYDAYVKAHAGLLMVVESEDNPEAPKVEMTPEQITALALTAVENFELNQDIYKELEYYKENGKILGVHPIFTERKLKASIDIMTVAEATKKMSNLDNYIRRSSKGLEKVKTEEAREKLTKKIQDWQTELVLVKAKLGFSDKE